MCQLGDEVRKKEGKLDSAGLTSQNFLFFKSQIIIFHCTFTTMVNIPMDNKNNLIKLLSSLTYVFIHFLILV